MDQQTPGCFPGLAHIPQLWESLPQGLRASDMETTGTLWPRGLHGQVWWPHWQADPFRGVERQDPIKLSSARTPASPSVDLLSGSCGAPDSGMGELRFFTRSQPPEARWPCCPVHTRASRCGFPGSPSFTRPTLGDPIPSPAHGVLPWELQLTLLLTWKVQPLSLMNWHPHSHPPPQP